MAVPEGKRKPGKLKALVQARDLAVYTLRICSNEKAFPAQYRNGLISRIEAEATGIFIDCWTANNIMVNNDAERLKERGRLQKRAMDSCNNLLALIMVAEKACHLRRKRVMYWGGLVLDVRNLIKAWKESDEKRYKSQTQGM